MMGNNTLRTSVDPYLHILRSAVRGTNDVKVRNDSEYARFELYKALEVGDKETARTWLSALRVSIDRTPEKNEWSSETQKSVADALQHIAKAIGMK